MSQAPALIFALLLLVLPLSALVARRLPAKQWLPMAGVWILIFAFGWMAFSYFT